MSYLSKMQLSSLKLALAFDNIFYSRLLLNKLFTIIPSMDKFAEGLAEKTSPKHIAKTTATISKMEDNEKTQNLFCGNAGIFSAGSGM